MPGVLLIETMAQTSGWLLIALTKFTRMPFFAAVKEAKLRSFVTPGQALQLSAPIMHEGSGYAVTQRRDPRATARSSATPRSPSAWSSSRAPDFRASMEKVAAAIAVPDGGARPWLTQSRARPGSPASASSPASAKALDAHWQALNARAARRRRRPRSRPTSCIRIAPLELDRQIPKKGDQRQMEPWQRIGTYAAGPRARQRRREGQARNCCRAWT